MRPKCLPNTGRTFQSFATCGASALTIYQRSISSRAGSRVRILAPAGHEQGSMESAQDYGESSLESLASYDPATSSWRTLQISFIEGLNVFSETWPATGTMRSGKLYRRVPLVRHTHESACSYWPTPNRPN